MKILVGRIPIASQDVIPHLPSLEEARSLHGKHGKLTDAFAHIALHPFTEVDVDSQHFQQLECFAVLVYDKTSEWMNQEKNWFATRGKQWIDFLQHKMHSRSYNTQNERVAYQAGIWCTSELNIQNAPTPEGCMGLDFQ